MRFHFPAPHCKNCVWTTALRLWSRITIEHRTKMKHWLNIWGNGWIWLFEHKRHLERQHSFFYVPLFFFSFICTLRWERIAEPLNNGKSFPKFRLYTAKQAFVSVCDGGRWCAAESQRTPGENHDCMASLHPAPLQTICSRAPSLRWWPLYYSSKQQGTVVTFYLLSYSCLPFCCRQLWLKPWSNLASNSLYS